MALENFTAAAAQLQTAAQALITYSSSTASDLASAKNELAAVDGQATTAIQPIIDALKSAVPPAQASAEPTGDNAQAQ